MALFGSNFGANQQHQRFRRRGRPDGLKIALADLNRFICAPPRTELAVIYFFAKTCGNASTNQIQPTLESLSD